MKLKLNLKTMKNKDIVFGIKPIIEVIKSGKTIDKLFIQKSLHNDSFAVLWKLVRSNRINYKHVPPEKINRITRKNHQGVVAFISPIDFYNIEDIVPVIFESGKNPLILILDRITDVRNFGAITRTAECAGVDAILVPENQSAAINADAIKTSSGALHKIKICRTWNIKLSIQFLKDSGIQIIGCSEKAKRSIYDVSMQSPTGIIIGSEENGISQEYLNMCNYTTKIPIYGTISSLNASVATGIILYESLRQRS